jgi:HPt (histidine-containing phosphotransfer) domain-containing protein
MSDTPVDKEALFDLVDQDPVFLETLIETFLDDCTTYMDEIRTAVEEDDAVALMREAHGLKGAVANLHAEPAWEAARRLEEIGRSGELEGAAPALATLEEEIDRLRSALGEMVEEET